MNGIGNSSNNGTGVTFAVIDRTIAVGHGLSAAASDRLDIAPKVPCQSQARECQFTAYCVEKLRSPNNSPIRRAREFDTLKILRSKCNLRALSSP